MPDKEKPSVVNTALKPETHYYLKSNNGNTVQVQERSVMDAQAQKGYFKPMPTFSGQLHTAKEGGIPYGYTSHSGDFYRATNTVQGNQLRQQYESEKRAYEQMMKKKAATTKRFATAKTQKNG